jgi:hypothetical protein
MALGCEGFAVTLLVALIFIFRSPVQTDLDVGAQRFRREESAHSWLFRRSMS